MYTSRPVDIHMLVDDTAEKFLTEGLNLVENPVYNVRVFYYRTSRKAMLARLRRTAVGKPGQERYMEMGSVHPAGTSKQFSLVVNGS